MGTKPSICGDTVGLFIGTHNRTHAKQYETQ